MKVVLVSSEPVDFTLAFANGLAPHAETLAILPESRYADLRPWFDPGLKLDLVDWPRTRSLHNPAFLAGLVGRIRAARPDVVHLLSNSSLWLNAAVPFCRGPLLVTTVHDVVVHPGDRDTARLPGWSARLLARQSDHLVVHGESLRTAAAAAFGKPADRVHVLSHPTIRRYADLARDLRLTRARPEGDFVVLFFGRVFAYKGLDTLIRAEAALGDRLPGLKVVIAGRGDDPGQLTHLMGNPARYEIHRGHIADRETAQLFTEADLVVLPYDEASQSGVLHLATSFGKPVVVTDVGELRATVEPNRLGLVVPPRSPDALAAAVLRLAENPAERESLGRQARAWSEGDNAATSVGAAAVSLYRTILGQAAVSSTKRMPPSAEDPNCPRGGMLSK
jgi:glycosyltransferase involved in cell wall biosynthesis